MLFFNKKKKIKVQETEISVTKINGEDYICLTDMVRGEEGKDHIKNWMRNRNTVEFLGVWEEMHNPDFKGVEFDTFRKEAGLNNFTLTPKKWVEATNAIGIVSKSGNGGGTYAHVDIAFEFGMWISPQFKLYLIKEYQRLKKIENNQYNLEWNVKRMISKTNYSIHTDAIKKVLIPQVRPWAKNYEYANEADLLNLAIFGMTAKQWKEANPERDKNGENMRDSASIAELIVISNAESLNAELIKEGLSKQERYERMQRMAQDQMKILSKEDTMKVIKKTSDDVYLIEEKKEE